MSASTQTDPGRTTPITNGNGHTARKTRGPNKAKAKAKAAAPAPQAAQTAVIAGPTAPRVTPIPITGGGSMISVAYLRDRLAKLEIERQTLQSLIAAAGPQRVAGPGAPRKSTKKKAKRKSPMKQAA